MTNLQYRICKYINKNHNLLDVCSKFKIDYLELQDKLGYSSLIFSDEKMDCNTKIELDMEVQDEFAEYKYQKRIMWLKSIWVPIAVTVAANLLIDVLKQLLPLIQQWLTNTP